MRRTLWILALSIAGTSLPAVAEEDGFDRPRRPEGSMYVRASEGSLPADGTEWDLADTAEERKHYPWNPEQLAADRLNAYFDPDLPEGRIAGTGGTAGGSVATSRAPARGVTFEGLNVETASYQGRLAFPPDATLGASRARVLQGSNVALRLTDRNGVEIDRQPLNSFFGFTGPSLLFDPKVYFDRMSERFYVVALEQDDSPRASGIWLAVSKEANPNALSAPSDFCTYRIPAKRGASWADYPLIGMNEDYFVVSVNNFRFNGTFRKAFMYVMEVEELVDNATTCPGLRIRRFGPPTGANGEPAFSIHPAQHYSEWTGTGPAPLYGISVAFFLPSPEYTLWKIAKMNGQPRLTKQLLTGDFAYTFAPTAPQRNGFTDLDAGDPRITQVAYRDGKLWAVHGTACSIGGLPNEACIRAIEVTPDGGPPAITFSETFGRPNTFLFWPGIAINKRGDVAMVFQRSKPNGFLGVVFNGKRANAGAFDTMRNLRIGNCALTHDPTADVTRTGDYVGIQTDPLDDLGFWMTGEYPGPVRSPAICDWKSYIGIARY